MNKIRIDEVDKYYKSATKIELTKLLLFWITILISFFMLLSKNWDVSVQNILQVSFIIFVIAHFTTSQINRFYLIPKAERMRRKQLISDSFGITLSHDRTFLYYNNEYLPSINRLGANTMENALFSNEIASSMLYSKRILNIQSCIA